jgi:hypothetical protein
VQKTASLVKVQNILVSSKSKMDGLPRLFACGLNIEDCKVHIRLVFQGPDQKVHRLPRKVACGQGCMLASLGLGLVTFLLSDLIACLETGIMSEIEEHEGTHNEEEAPVSRAELDKVPSKNQEPKGGVQTLKDKLEALKAKMGDTSKAVEQSKRPHWFKYAEPSKLVVDEKFDVRAWIRSMKNLPERHGMPRGQVGVSCSELL